MYHIVMMKHLAALFCSILPFILPAQLDAADHDGNVSRSEAQVTDEVVVDYFAMP